MTCSNLPYRQDFIDQNLDTNINDEQLREYYQKGENNFVLQENILKVRYLVVDVKAPELNEARQ
ncbi:MAG: hypothetical protein U5L96_08545 [Owenweeksia sp.]|nr:hypothetical protein [Owenweeksia sp.]